MQKREERNSAVEWIRVAKRENNTKRTYLIVNPYQGKHVPVSPEKARSLSAQLGEKLRERVRGEEKVLVIAFAETATAIGAGAAASLDGQSYYIQTTRETDCAIEYLYFSEVHSHASQQKLAANGLKEVLEKCGTVIFAEDEVTTGNTICNLIEKLERFVPDMKHQYIIASILNGMDAETEEVFRQKQIGLVYLGKSKNEKYSKLVERAVCNGKRICCTGLVRKPDSMQVKKIFIKDGCNPRVLVRNKTYQEKCRNFCKKALEELGLKGKKSILVLGTEECMYPGLCLADEIRGMETVQEVRFHATTRSPILTSQEPDYPLHARYELKSLYDSERKTFVYDLKKYDLVIIVTDTETEKNEGLETLLYALSMQENKAIAVIEWRK